MPKTAPTIMALLCDEPPAVATSDDAVKAVWDGGKDVETVEGNLVGRVDKEPTSGVPDGESVEDVTII